MPPAALIGMPIRYIYTVLAGVPVMLIALGFIWPGLWWLLLLGIPLAGLGIYDRLQTRHTILRIYPVAGHLRFLLEGIGPELHQYVVEADTDGRPFTKEQRSIVYERAKGVSDVQPFGTRCDPERIGAEWGNHALLPADLPDEPPRVVFGGKDGRPAYEAALLNISAMSFGSLGPNAIRALNRGAKRGGFAHNTGEGGISRYHREGGDLIWQIGSGYFGCRTDAGGFDPDRFAEKARDPQVRMIEIKLSQGAKPGHGGVLPAAKVTEEIAEARGVPVNRDVVSPARHAEFSTPRELLAFVERLRELSGGKPTGFKLCVGRRRDVLAVCKAMRETGITPDFVTVDGAEGGTGAAPFEFSDSLGMPMRLGLRVVHDALVGAGLRDDVRIIASGKLISGFDVAVAMAMGADTVNSARGMLFALGCIQALRCHDNTCPTGITTLDPWRQGALDVADKARRVERFQRGTVRALMEVCAALGCRHPAALDRHMFSRRVDERTVERLDTLYPALEPGALLDESAPADWVRDWMTVSANRFDGHS